MTHFTTFFICQMVLLSVESSSRWTEESVKYGCTGDSIVLFRNIKIDVHDKVVSLQRNGNQNQRLAMWTLQNNTVPLAYSEKVFMDEFGDIWIRNVELKDTRLYILTQRKGTETAKDIVNLIVILAPTKDCKPKITLADNVLTADLDKAYCGQPTPSVYWMHHTNMYHAGNYSVKAHAKHNAGIYYACIEGLALRCAKELKPTEFCSAFETNEGNCKPNEESWIPKDMCVISIAANIVICLVLVVSTLIYVKH